MGTETKKYKVHLQFSVFYGSLELTLGGACLKLHNVHAKLHVIVDYISESYQVTKMYRQRLDCLFDNLLSYQKKQK